MDEFGTLVPETIDFKVGYFFGKGSLQNIG